jgi:Uma2 family endonuclease
MATEQKLMTVEDLHNLPPTDMRTELIDGVLVEMSPAGGVHGRIVSTISVHLWLFVRPQRLGEILSGDPGVILGRNPDRVRAPDVCFVSAERLPHDGIPRGFLEFVPDLIVEVVSPDDRAREIRQKTREWLDAGARVVWTVYPDTREVVVSRSNAEARPYQATDTLDAEPVLHGFSVTVADLFD